MFQRLRRNQGSYWHLPDDGDDVPLAGAKSFCTDVGTCNAELRFSCLPTVDRVIQAAKERAAKAATRRRSTEQTTAALSTAMQLQMHYTSWPSDIWDLNFEDADGEIVFDWQDDDDDATGSSPVYDSTSSKSVGTIETQDETEDDTIPSPFSSPDQEFQNTWELQDLDLSEIVPEEEDDGDSDSCSSLVSSPLRGLLFTSPPVSSPFHGFHDYDQRVSSPLVASSAELGKNFLSDNHSYVHFDQSPTQEVTYFDSLIVEESFYFLPQTGKHPSPPVPSDIEYRRKRTLRFADEEGKPLETIHLLDTVKDEEEDPTLQRLLILMLLPEDRKFEFVHAEYVIESRLSVSCLLQQLPDMVVNEQLKQQRYCRICHAAGGSELINAFSIQDHGLASDDILVAVPKGYTGAQMYEIAKGLVENEKILRAVMRTNRCEHILHRFKSNEEFMDIQFPPEPTPTRRKKHENARQRRDNGLPYIPSAPRKVSSSKAKVEIDRSIGFSENVDPNAKTIHHKPRSSLSDSSNKVPSHDYANDGKKLHRASSRFYGDSPEQISIKLERALERLDETLMDDEGDGEDFASAWPSFYGQQYDEFFNPTKSDSSHRPKKHGLFGKKLFQLGTSKTSEFPVLLNSNEEENISQQAQKANWASRFAKKRWEKLKTVGKRRKEGAKYMYYLK